MATNPLALLAAAGTGSNPFIPAPVPVGPIATPGGGGGGAPPQGPMSNPANTSPGANLLRILSLASGVHPQVTSAVPAPVAVPAPAPAPAPVAAPVVAPSAPAPIGLTTPAAHPNFGAYIPQGLAMMLSRLAGNGMLDNILNRGGFDHLLGRFGLTPDQIGAPGFDPSQLYTRQMARADYRAGNTPAAPGMVPNGWTAPIGFHQPIGMGGGQPQPPAPTGVMPTNPNQPLGTPQGS